MVSTDGGPGKGQALRRAVAETAADVLVFLDADIVNFTPRYVTGLTSALLADPGLKLVKGAYRRPLHGRPGEGKWVTELVARPLLERFFPELATVTQPLSGECALTRDLAERLCFDDGYGIEIGALIDTYLAYGRRAIAEVDLGGERVHRNRPLRELTVDGRAQARQLGHGGAGPGQDGRQDVTRRRERDRPADRRLAGHHRHEPTGSAPSPILKQIDLDLG